MKRVNQIIKTTNNKFLNMYDFIGVTKSGKDMKYHVSSRAKDVEDLRVKQDGIYPDAAIIYAIVKGEEERMVVIKQYRYSIDDYIYELPAGLIDAGETLEMAAIRELKEETGLDLEIIPCASYMNKPFFTSVGLSDECCSTVFGYATGSISTEGLEDSEDLEILLVNRQEAKEILEKGIIAVPVGYMMLHFIASEDGHALDFVK